jgi:hypothetical protein
VTDADKSLSTQHKLRDGEPLIRRRVLAMAKRAARSVVSAPSDQRQVVLILGCQRSGTTMLQQTFLDRSWRVLILEEHDRRLVGNVPGEAKWLDYPTVFARIRRLPFEVVAVKPLVESDRFKELMDAAGTGRAIWMLRHYEEVARSNLRCFGPENPYRDLQPFRSGDALDWRYRGASQETRDTVIELLDDGLEPLDAAALFWWTRNQLYFDQRLWEDDRIRILRYERAATGSDEVIRALSHYVGVPLPLHSIAAKVRPQPGTSSKGGLKPEVERLCQEMWDSFTGYPEL